MSATGTTRVDMTSPTLQPKIFHAGDDWVGQAYVAISEDNIILAGDLNSGITVSAEYGVGLSGQVSITTTPDQVSFCGGYWRINPLMLASIGSSSALPMPWLVPGTPQLIASAKGMASAVSGMEKYL